MRILNINSQIRSDFHADYICEHCLHVIKDQYGYDDANYHDNVIPQMMCPKCGKKADRRYRPLRTKYPEDYNI